MKRANLWAWWGWEPLCFYESCGLIAPGLAGEKSDFLKKWWRAIHSEEVVEWAAGFGIDRAVTHFQKGFGPACEKEGMAQTAELAKLLHKHGIGVFGYLQYGSLFAKTFFREFPEAEKWCAVDENGAYRRWCGRQERLMPCPESAEFLAYLKRQIRTALTDCGLDGLHFDNFYSPPCYCPRCRKAFGEELPPPGDDGEPGRRWAEFRSRRLAERMEELTACARSFRGDVELIWNPGAISPRSDQAMARSADFVKLGPVAGLLWCEGANFPRILENTAVHQVNYFKTGEALGFRQFPTSWIYSGEDSRLAQTDFEVTLSFAESVAFHAVPGSNWLLRPARLKHFCAEDDALSGAFRDCAAFFRRYADLFENSVSKADIAIEVEPEALRRTYFPFNDALLAVEQLLLENHRPFDLSFRKAPSRYGHRLRLGREIPVDAGWGKKKGTLDADVVFAPRDAAARDLLARLPREEIKAPPTVFLSHRQLPDGREMLHLLNYNAPAKAVARLSRKWQGAVLLQPGKQRGTAGTEVAVPVWCVLIR